MESSVVIGAALYVLGALCVFVSVRWNAADKRKLEEATKAAEEAAAERGDEVNNDYYIVNDNPRLRTLVARGDTVVRVLDGGEPDLRETNVADFAVERSAGAGLWVTVEDGIVTEIEQQFVP